MYIDTHCHIHDSEFAVDGARAITVAQKENVEKVICVGTDLRSSVEAVEFAKNQDGAFAAIGLHPHDAEKPNQQPGIERLVGKDKVVAVGECGLDYFYLNSAKESQLEALEWQFALAHAHKLPMIFHIRGSKENPQDAFDDFWQVYDNFKVPGVVHSFSAYPAQVEQILARNLYFGVNGIATFMKDDAQIEAIRSIPLENLLLETDAPFLTPEPFRGKINEPKHIPTISKFLATLKGIETGAIESQTTDNAQRLFGI